MGAKQSKRSVDITGEAAAGGAGEVAAAGAGGEGRVEALADADAAVAAVPLKPQLNGDTPHIQLPEEISEKEKQLDNGTAENEKDATTEKETAVNGGDEQENGDAKPAAPADADNSKKNKKEKVKKKWSLRSISFSRKDKPKQEKKHKDEEPKLNGDAEKLAEEGTDATAVPETKSSEEVKTVGKVEENKDEKTPETPVTEPITNGSSAPETPKEETPTKVDIPAPSPTVEKPTEQVKTPEELPNLAINGLSLEDVKEEVPEVKIIEAAESKVEEPAVLVPEQHVSTPDIPVAAEVCVEQSPLTEPTPPPLPHNPPPSSVTAFAETTMALHTVDASPVAGALPALTATPDIAPLVEEAPLDIKLDSQVPQINLSSKIATTTSNAELDGKVEMDDQIKIKDEKVNTNLADALVPVSEVVEKKSLQQFASFDATIECSDESTNKADTLNSIDIQLTLPKPPESFNKSFAQIQDVAEVPQININAQNMTASDDRKENGIGDSKEAILNGNSISASDSIIEITKNIINTVEIISVDSCTKQIPPVTETFSKPEGNTNGSTVEAELILQSDQAVISDETIPPPAKPESLPISSLDVEEAAADQSDEAQSPTSPLSEAPPPPAQEEASDSGEEIRGSNEEVSGSFPLPPSDLCPSESEVSGPATPEPPQEAPPAIEKSIISVTESLPEKPQLVDIVEVRSAAAPETTVVTAAGAGDGAPSD